MTTDRSWRVLAGAILLTATVATGTACATPRGRVYLRVGPPAPIVETRLVAPGPGYVWVAGYHRWDGRVYAWVPGVWLRSPRPRAVWVAGRWVHEGRHGWYFVDGHWR